MFDWQYICDIEHIKMCEFFEKEFWLYPGQYEQEYIPLFEEASRLIDEANSAFTGCYCTQMSISTEGTWYTNEEFFIDT